MNSHRFSSSSTLGSSEELTDTAVTLTDPMTNLSPSQSIASTAAEILEPIKEVPFTELGLGGWTPVGLLQHLLEGLHIGLDLPWWGAIAVGTVIVRCCLFPVVVKQQRHAMNMNNHMPRFQELTKKMNEARQTGDQYEMVRTSSEMQAFVKKHDVNPLKSFMGILIQAPVMISFFISLRRMAELPVESLTQGGMSWFTDLSITDPYYALPVLASVSMLAIIQLGGEAGVSNPQADKIKKYMRFLPFVILPFTAHLPAAVFMYWLTNNTLSVVQVFALRFPEVRRKLGIPQRVIHPPSELTKNEGFIKGIKEGWSNASTTQDVMQKKQAHVRMMKEAGTGPIPKTFTYDPTQQSQPAHNLSTKTKDVRKKLR